MSYLKEFWERRRGLLGLGALVIGILILMQARVGSVMFEVADPRNISMQEFRQSCESGGGEFSERELCAGVCFTGYQCGIGEAPDSGRLCSSTDPADGKPVSDCWACYYGSKIPVIVEQDGRTNTTRHCNEFQAVKYLMKL